MRLSGKYVSAQTQVFVLFWTKVDQQIAVWLARRVLICFDGKLRRLWIHLTSQIRKLTGVSGILEQDHVVSIQTHGTCELVLGKQVLCEENDTDVAMMRAFCEQVGNSVVRFLHEIVDDQHSGLSAVEVVDVWQTVVECHSRILTEQFLEFAVAVNDF